ncbi:MAG: peroxiredoxin [Candidatus Cryosericum sp.]
MKTVGETMPSFELQDQHGDTVQDTDLRGQWILLYCYPKDMTPGCSQEARDVQAAQSELSNLGIRAVGVSADSVASHVRFAAKLGLTFTLLSDPQHVLLEALGAWKLKKLAGHEYMGTERSTFLVDARGRIVREWRGVKVAGHVAAVLAAAREAMA